MNEKHQIADQKNALENSGWPFGRVLMLAIGGVVFMSTMLFGWLMYETRSTYVEKRIFSDLESWRDNKIRGIQRWASGMIRFGHLVAEDPEVIEICLAARNNRIASESAHPELIEKIRRYQGGKEISLFLPGAEHAFCTSEFVLPRAHEMPRGLAERAMAARGPVLSDVFLCTIHGLPHIMVAAPVYCEVASAPVAIAGFLFELDELFTGILKGIPLGETGEIVLANASGVVQCPLRFMPDALARTYIRTEMMDLAKAGFVGRREGFDYRGAPVVSAYGHIPELHWGLVAKQDVAELRQPVLQLRNQALVLVLGVTFLGLFFAAVLARLIASPAIGLADLARRVASGETGLRAAPEGVRELREIADGFNRMLASLDREMAVARGVSRLLLAGASQSHLDRLFRAMLPELLEECRGQIAVAYIRDFESASFRRIMAIGCPGDRFPERFRLDTPDSWLAQTAGKSLPSVCDGWPVERTPTLPIPGGEISLRGLMGIPVMRETEVIAVIGVVSIHDFRQQDIQVAEYLSRFYASVIMTCQANERAEELTMELQSSNQELTATNEELQAQSEELHAQATHLQDMTRELDVKRRQVEEADRLKSEFLSNMSHELRTPLNSILALSQLMSTRGPGKNVEQDREYLSVIERNGRHLLELINDILDLSKIEAGRMEVVSARFDPKAMLRRAVATIEPLAEQKGLTLRTSFESLPEMVSDEGKIRQICLNLLSNAVKFTESGTIEVDGKMDGERVLIEIRDSGIGIPDADQGKLFEKFRQIDGSNTRRHAGTGLGLAISRKLARLLDGDITCISREGEGSSFTLSLPVSTATRTVVHVEPGDVPAFTDGDELRETLRKPAATPRPDAPKSVLIVDDNSIAALQIQTALERERLTIAIARNGAEALQAVRQKAPDIVVLDLMMPGVNGFEFLEQLRSFPEFEKLPVMVLTAQELTTADRNLLARLKTAEIFQKGAVDREALVKGVRRVLQLGRGISPGPRILRPQGGTRFSDILIVEDNPDNLFTLREILAEIDADLVVASNGSEALSIVRDRRPGLILMDVHLPGRSGVEAVADLKSDPETASIPVVAMTARAMKGDREEFLLKGFDDYLPKPLDPPAVVALVRRWLDVREVK